MADTPITREEQYLAYLNGEVDTIPTPITRVEQFLYQLCMNAGNGTNGVGVVDDELNPTSTNAIANKAVSAKFAEIYSDDASDLIETHTVKNMTLGMDVGTNLAYALKHIRIGKVHYVFVSGGIKIQNATTTTYQVSVNIKVPGNFAYGEVLKNSPSINITTLSDPVLTFGSTEGQIDIVYTQPNSASQYSPDSLYYITSIMMLLEN